MNRRPLALLTALATMGACSPVPLGADFVIEAKRESQSSTPRYSGFGRNISASELVRMRRKNARKRR